MKKIIGNHDTTGLTDLTNSTTAFLTTLPTTICIVFLVTSEGTPVRTYVLCVCVYIC